MFAIVAAGGKQYKVAAGDIIDIEKIEGEAGAEVELGPVLMAGQGAEVKIGLPAVEDVKVTAKVIVQGRGPKVIAFKGRKRKDSKTKIGHRQSLTTVQIISVQ